MKWKFAEMRYNYLQIRYQLKCDTGNLVAVERKNVHILWVNALVTVNQNHAGEWATENGNALARALMEFTIPL